MVQPIVDYLKQNQTIYSKEQLISSLIGAGYKQIDIEEAVNLVYGQVVDSTYPDDGARPTTQSPVLTNTKVNILPIILKSGLVSGLAIALISLVAIVIGLVSSTSAKGDYIGSFSAQSGSNNSMVSIEKALIKPGTYNINKSTQLVDGGNSYLLKLSKAVVSDTDITFEVSISIQNPVNSYAYLFVGSKDAKLLTENGKEISKVDASNYSSGKNNEINYSAYFSKDKTTLNGFAIFSQPTIPSNSFTFQYPSFPKIEWIVFK